MILHRLINPASIKAGAFCLRCSLYLPAGPIKGKDFSNKKQSSIIRADASVVGIAQKDTGKIEWDPGSNRWVFGGLMSMKLDPGIR